MYHGNAARVAPASRPTPHHGSRPAHAPESSADRTRRHAAAVADLDRQFVDALVAIELAEPAGQPEPRMRFADAKREVPRTHPVRTALQLCLASLDMGKPFDVVMRAASLLPHAVRTYHLATCQARGGLRLASKGECFAREQIEQAEGDVAQAHLLVTRTPTVADYDRAIKETEENLAATSDFLDVLRVERAALVRGESATRH